MGSGKTQVPALRKLIWATTLELSCRYSRSKYTRVVKYTTILQERPSHLSCEVYWDLPELQTTSLVDYM